LLKQVYFKDSVNFYEHSTQEQLLFLDLKTTECANSYFGVSIPVNSSWNKKSK
jgi:hypothetical protein